MNIVRCPNINHHDWKELKRKIGETEAKREFLKNDQFLPDPNNYKVSIRVIAEKNLINTSGFFSNHINPNIIKSELRKEGYLDMDVKPTSNRGGYYLTKNNRFYNPYTSKYQLEGSKENIDEELDFRVKEFLRLAGVKVEFVDSLKTDRGMNATAVADTFNKIIKVVKGEQRKDTLSEEAGHFLVAMVKGTDLYEYMNNLIDKTNVYREVIQDYSEEYDNNDTLLREEAMGKAIAKYLSENGNITPEIEPVSYLRKQLFNLLDRIFGRLTNIFKIVDSNEVQRQLDEVFGLAASKIEDGNIEGLKLGELEDSKLYQLKEGEKTGDEVIDNTINNYKDTITRLQNSKTGDKNKNSIINTKIEQIEKKIEDLIATKNYNVLLKLGNIEIIESESLLKTWETQTVKDKENTIKIVHQYIDGWTPIFESLRFSEGDERIKIVDELIGKARRISNQLNILTQDFTNQLLQGDEASPVDLFGSQKDIGKAERFLLDISTSRHPLLRKVFKFVHNSLYKAKELTRLDNIETDTQIKKIEEWAKRNGLSMKEVWETFKQKRNSIWTGNYVGEYSQEYYDELKKLATEARQTNNWKKYRKFKEDNTQRIIKVEEYNKALQEARELYIDQGKGDEASYLTWIKLHDPNGKGKEKDAYVDLKPLDKWKDNQFIYIQSVPELKEFYDYFVSKLNERKNPMWNGGDELQSNYLPELKKNFIYDLAKFNISAIIKGSKDWFIDAFTVPMESKLDSNIINKQTGKPEKLIPIYMMSNSLNIENKESDLGKILKSFTTMSYLYEHRHRVIDPIMITRNLFEKIGKEQLSIEGTNIHKTDKYGDLIDLINANKNALGQLDYYMDSQIFDKTQKKQGTLEKNFSILDKEILTKEGEVENQKRYISGSKIGNELINYTRLKGMAFNIFSGVTNLTVGQASNLIWAAGGQDFTEAEVMKALGIKLGSIANRENNEKIKLLAEYFQIHKIHSQENRDSWLNKIGFGFMTMSENFNHEQLMIAMLLNTKVGDKTAWEGFKVEKGELVWDETLGENPLDNLTEEKFDFISRLEKIISFLHGNYNSDTPKEINSGVFGRLSMIFRNWIPSMTFERVGGAREDEQLGREFKGRWYSYRAYNNITEGAGSIVKGIIQQMSFNMIKLNAYGTLSEQDQINMKKNVMELMLVGNLAILALILKGVKLDPDDEKGKWALKFGIREIMQTQNDLTFFVNPMSFTTLAGNISPATKTLTDFQNLILATGRLIRGEDELKTGVHKGQSNFYRKLKAAVPYTNQWDRFWDIPFFNTSSGGNSAYYNK